MLVAIVQSLIVFSFHDIKFYELRNNFPNIIRFGFAYFLCESLCPYDYNAL